jgi:hypothetical protein
MKSKRWLAGFALSATLLLMGNAPHPSAPCVGKQEGDACQWGYAMCSTEKQVCQPGPAGENIDPDTGELILWCRTERQHADQRATETAFPQANPTDSSHSGAATGARTPSPS